MDLGLGDKVAFVTGASGGIGQALIRSLRDRTDGRVEWNVLDWNQPSIDFYESLGARPLPGWITYRWAPEE